MKDKYETEEYVSDEEKFSRNGPLRQDSEFFDDKSYVVHDIIGVKRIEFNKGEDWEITSNSKIVLVLKGARFTSKERDFLRGVDGMKFIISGYRDGWKSVSEFKRHLKGVM